MAMNFPDAPAVNDVFTVGTRSWKWDGSTWNVNTTYPAHASTHLTAGSDPLTLPQSQITNLTTDLAAKAPLIGPSFSNTAQTTVNVGAGALISGTGGNTLQILQPTVNADAYIIFHIAGDYAAHFGIDGTSNDLAYGGWSAGAVKHKVVHNGNRNPIQDKSASYTIVATDRYSTIRSTNAAITITIPNVFNIGDRVDVIQYGAGQVTFAASGITLNSKGAKLKTAGQYSAVTIMCVASNVYCLIGDLG